MVLNFLELFFAGKKLNNNTTSSNLSVAIATQIKFNDHVSKNGIVPIRSRAKLFCEVSFQGVSMDLLNVVLVSFVLPSGEHIIPGNCFVAKKRKKCKMVIKKVTKSDEGKYSCLVYYFDHGGSVKNNSKDFIISKLTEFSCLIYIFNFALLLNW